MSETSKQIEELFSKYLERVESTSYKISYYDKEKLLSGIKEHLDLRIEEKKKEIEEVRMLLAYETANSIIIKNNQDKEIERLKNIAMAYVRHNKKNQ